MSGPIVFACTLLVKVTVLLVMGFAVVGAVRRYPAALHHRIWALMFGGALMLPLLMAALPAWQVLPLPLEGPEVEGLPVTSSAGAAGHSAEPGAWVDPLESVTPGPALGGVSGVESVDQGRSVSQLLVSRLDLVLIGGWILGSVVILLWLGAALRNLDRLRRRAVPVRERRILDELDALRGNLGMTDRRIRLLVSTEVRLPVTWGGSRPVVFLPPAITTGSHRAMRMVMLHELLHVRRWDWLVRIGVLAVCALYWFHPLVWLARRHMLAAEERAVDEAAVDSGFTRVEYAEQLVRVARLLGRAPEWVSVAVPFARPRAIQKRLQNLVRPTAAPRRLTRGMRLGVTTGAVFFVIGVSVLEGRSFEGVSSEPPLEIADLPHLTVSVPGASDGAFPSVAAPFLLPGGDVVVPIGDLGQLRVFGSGGKLVETLGGPGGDSGAFEDLSAAWARGDTIEAFDAMLQRITRFLPDGGVEVVGLAREGGGPLTVIPGALSDGWLVAAVTPEGSSGRDRVVLERVDRNGRQLGLVAETEGIVRYRFPGGSSPEPLSPRGLVEVRDGRVYAAETLSPTIKLIDPDRGLERRMDWEVETSLPPDEAFRLVADSALARSTPDRASDIRRRLDAASSPDRISAFWDFIVDEEGLIWVRTFDPIRDAAILGGLGTGSYLQGGAGPGGEWRIFTPEGVEIGSIEIPEGFEPTHISRDAVVGVYHSAFTEGSVGVHALRRW